MPLKETDIPISLNTSRHNPVKQLFIPALKNSTRFDVAVGYFTSGWLKDTAEGIAEFALSGGLSRWVISPELQSGDEEGIVINSINRNYFSARYQERGLLEVINALESDAKGELCALVASGVLEFRIAIPKDASQGMFHAKLGVFNDVDGSKLGFSGSYNFTSAAKSNWERIDVYKSWIVGDEQRIVNLDEEFNDLWTNNDPKYVVLTPSSKLINLVKTLADANLLRVLIENKEKKGIDIKLRGYQEDAIKAWGNKGPGETKSCNGTYVMATGSGKTITALATIEKMIAIVVEKRSRPLMIVIVLPLKHLLDQWYREALGFGFESIRCYENSNFWRKSLAESLSNQKTTNSGYVIAMVTNSTFAMKNFQNEIAKINTDFLIVADEAHNLGSATYLKALPENANFRLALSATPDRYNDSAGTKELFNYFGDPVINFSLENAINENFLCPYDYHPHLCPMSELEYEEYIELTDLIREEKIKTDEKGEKTKKLNQLQGKRNDLITGVASKLDILKEQLKKQHADGGVSHTLIYCGMRRGEDELRHIERTVKLIGSVGIKTRKFTADESLDDRREILKLFASGELESIAAIKCLDEGVDIPATRVAYILASTANPREFIQRRGRVLRKSEGKSKAIIHDFMIAPPFRRNEEDDMVERELERGLEFARLALNIDECMPVLDEFANNFGIKL
jgi:superfamily II DNA or RNA helicase